MVLAEAVDGRTSQPIKVSRAVTVQPPAQSDAVRAAYRSGAEVVATAEAPFRAVARLAAQVGAHAAPPLADASIAGAKIRR